MESWFKRNGVALGLPLAILVAAALAGAIVIPLGPATLLIGTIQRFGVTETQQGGYPVAGVVAGDGRYQVPLTRANDCVVGGQIRFTEVRHLFGPSFEPAYPPCGYRAR